MLESTSEDLLEYFEDELKCGCCYELMVEPTTLDCGHTFCRLCLATWWHTSKNLNCLVCRRPSEGFPQVAVQLRNTVKKLFPEKLAERQAVLESDSNNTRMLKEFAAFGEKLNNARERQGQVNRNGPDFKKLLIILAIFSGVIVCFYEVLGMVKGKQGPLVRKPIHEWTPEDVALWVGSLGSWANDYESRFLYSGVDGNILMDMTETDLEQRPLRVSFPPHRRALLKEIESLRSHGMKVPTNFWEYKAAYPIRSMFLLWGFREFPRLTLAYSFLMYSEEIFLPILKLTSETVLDDLMVNDTQQTTKPIPDVEYLRFTMRTVLLPYYLIGKCAFAWLHINHWIAGLVIVTCVLMTAAESTKVKWLFVGGWKKLPKLCVTYTATAIGNGLFHVILWSFLPLFICDIFFYWMLFGCPLYGWKNLKASFSENVEEDNQLTRNLMRWLWRTVRTRVQVVFHVE